MRCQFLAFSPVSSTVTDVDRPHITACSRSGLPWGWQAPVSDPAHRWVGSVSSVFYTVPRFPGLFFISSALFSSPRGVHDQHADLYSAPYQYFGSITTAITDCGSLATNWETAKPCSGSFLGAPEAQAPFTIVGQPYACRGTTPVPSLKGSSISTINSHLERCSRLWIYYWCGEPLFCSTLDLWHRQLMPVGRPN